MNAVSFAAPWPVGIMTMKTKILQLITPCCTRIGAEVQLIETSFLPSSVASRNSMAETLEDVDYLVLYVVTFDGGSLVT